MAEQKVKPKCYGCGKAESEETYIWHNDHLWHVSCYCHTGTMISTSGMSAEDKQEAFIFNTLHYNKQLAQAVKDDDKPVLEKFWKKVATKRGIEHEQFIEIIGRLKEKAWLQ